MTTPMSDAQADEMVDQLIAASNEPSEQDARMAPVLEAAEAGDVKAMVAALDALGVPIDTQGEDGDTALHIGCLHGQTAVVVECLKRGASVTATDEDGSTPLHDASAGGHYMIAKMLIQKGAKIDALDSDGESPLHLATNGGHQAIVDLLLSTLGDAAPGLLKKPNGEGATPIDLAEDPALIAKLKIACGEEDEDEDGAGAAFKRTKA